MGCGVRLYTSRSIAAAYRDRVSCILQVPRQSTRGPRHARRQALPALRVPPLLRQRDGQGALVVDVFVGIALVAVIVLLVVVLLLILIL